MLQDRNKEQKHSRSILFSNEKLNEYKNAISILRDRGKQLTAIEEDDGKIYILK